MRHLWWVGMIAFFISGCGLKDVERLEAERGVFDIQNAKSIDEIYELNGLWYFVPGKHVEDYQNINTDSAALEDPELFFESPEAFDIINKATFYVQIKAPSSLENPALFVPVMSGKVDVFVNDEVVFCNDPTHKSEEEITPIRSEIIDLPKAENNVYHLMLHGEPTILSQNLIYDHIKFGSQKAINDKYGEETLIKIFIAASYLILGIYLLTMFGMMPKEKSLLYFALFSFLLTMRLMVTGDILINYLLDLPWDILFKLEYLSFYGSALFMALFMHELFKKHITIHFFQAIVIIMCLFIILVVFASPEIFFLSSLPFQVFMIMISIHPLYQIFRLAFSGNYMAQVFLAGFTVFYLTVIHDILYLNNVIHSIQLFQYGNIFLIIAMSFLLPMFFTRTYNRAEQLNKKILLQNTELNKINNDLERFVYSVTHDLKAPLASLQGLVNLAKLENSEPKTQDLFNKQEESINKLKDYIDEILTLSKNNQSDLKIDTIDIRSLLEDTISGFSYLSKSDLIEKNIEVNQESEFKSDLFRLKTVLRNLISNSIKYSDVEKAQPFMNLKVNITEMEMSLEITDNGLGIAEEYQKKLFTMFFRAHGAEIEGTGLGLYIVKECLDLLKGSIDITSIENIGTTVKVTLPNAKNQLIKSYDSKKRNKNKVNRKIRAIGLKAQRKLRPKLKRA